MTPPDDRRRLKFIVDAMLGNIVSWLRILGYDTIYWSGEDSELLETARKTGRVILTMDRELASTALRSNVKTLLISENQTSKTLTELSRQFGLSLEFDPWQTRCPNCNHLLVKTKSEPREEWICPNCGKHYWIGGHWRNIVRVLKEAKAKIAEA